MKASNYMDNDFLKQYNKVSAIHKFIIFPALFKMLKDVKDKKILDLGCGPGNLAYALAKKGANVIGY